MLRYLSKLGPGLHVITGVEFSGNHAGSLGDHGALLFVALTVGYSMSGEYRRASFWGNDWVGKPLSERVQVLPKDIADSLHGGVFGAGFAKNIAPAENAEYMVDDLRAALDSIPEPVKKLVEGRLIGVYLVQGMNLNDGSHAAGMAIEVINFFRQYFGNGHSY